MARKEGRLAIVVVVAVALLVGVSIGNALGRDAADAVTTELRRALRSELALVDDEALAAYPRSREAIESAAARAARGRGSVAGSLRPERRSIVSEHMVVVAVDVRWGWLARCVRAELRGGGRVITHVDGHAC